MSSAFTEYIRSLEPGAEPPPAERFEAFWDLLRDALISEMKKRGLWRIPPRCLGIYGHSSWTEGDALDEIAADCYAFLISRLRGLKAQLEHRSDIDGLLFLNVRHFLYETQKRHDPLGFRVFSLLQAAVREAIAEGALHVAAGDLQIRNDTLLAFAPEKAPESVCADAGLSERVGRWSDGLLPDLVSAFGRGVGKVRSQLKAHILDLESQGVAAFRFGEVIEPLKRELRARWSAIWRVSEGTVAVEDDEEDLVTFVRWVDPDLSVEERQSFHQLLACVDEAIVRLALPRDARDRLHRLWRYLRSHAADSPEGEPAPSRAIRRPPSRRTIARHLGIPRDRLSDLLSTLGRVVEACRADTSGKTPVREKREAGGGVDSS